MEKNIDLSALFDKFDYNGSHSLDYKEFTEMVYFLAPKYRKDQVIALYEILDMRADGLVEKD